VQRNSAHASPHPGCLIVLAEQERGSCEKPSPLLTRSQQLADFEPVRPKASAIPVLVAVARPVKGIRGVRSFQLEPPRPVRHLERRELRRIT